MNFAEARHREIVRDEVQHTESRYNQLFVETQGQARIGVDGQIQQLISQHQIELQKRDQTLHDLKAEHNSMIRQLRTQLDTERDELRDQLELRMNGFLEGYSKMSIEFEETKKERDDLLEALRAVRDTPSKPSMVGIRKESGEFAPPIGRELFSGIVERGFQSDLREKAPFPVP